VFAIASTTKYANLTILQNADTYKSSHFCIHLIRVTRVYQDNKRARSKTSGHDHADSPLRPSE